MRMEKLMAAPVVLWLLGVGAVAAQSKSVSGVVANGNGVPIANATIYLSGVPGTSSKAATARSTPYVTLTTATGADGAFTLGGIPPGIYGVCVYGAKDTHLSSCEWGQGVTRVDLTSVQQVSGLRFQIEDGAMISLYVADPLHLIRDPADPQEAGHAVKAANFRIGIFAGTRYVPATLVNATGTTRLYQVAVPKAASVRLFLGTSLPVREATGVALAVGQLGKSIAPVGAAAAAVYLTIP